MVSIGRAMETESQAQQGADGGRATGDAGYGERGHAEETQPVASLGTITEDKRLMLDSWRLRDGGTATVPGAIPGEAPCTQAPPLHRVLLHPEHQPMGTTSPPRSGVLIEGSVQEITQPLVDRLHRADRQVDDLQRQLGKSKIHNHHLWRELEQARVDMAAMAHQVQALRQYQQRYRGAMAMLQTCRQRLRTSLCRVKEMEAERRFCHCHCDCQAGARRTDDVDGPTAKDADAERHKQVRSKRGRSPRVRGIAQQQGPSLFVGVQRSPRIARAVDQGAEGTRWTRPASLAPSATTSMARRRGRDTVLMLDRSSAPTVRRSLPLADADRPMWVELPTSGASGR